MYNTLEGLIDQYIIENTQGKITGTILNNVLKEMVSQLGSGSRFGGAINPASNVPQNDYDIFYFASSDGIYANFDSIEVLPTEIAFVRKERTSWVKYSWNISSLLANKQDTINDLDTIRSGASAGAAAYQKPQSGIPKTDLAADIQASLEKADTAIQEHQDISGKADKSDTYTKSEVDAKVVSVMRYKGSVNNYAALQAIQNPSIGDVYNVLDTGHNYAYDGTSWDVLSGIVNVDGKADKVSNATNGNFAGLDENGNPTDSGSKASDFATASQGEKADTAYQKPSSGIPQSDLSSDVQSQLNRHFKGWFNSLEELKTAHTAADGDSAYVKDASPATTWSIYVYDSTASSDNYWADSGTDADTSNVQTFASSEEVNETYIDDTHLVNPKSGALPTANDVLQLKAKLEGVTASETKVQLVASGDGQNVFNGQTLCKSSNTSQLPKIYVASTNPSNQQYIVIDVEGYKSVRFLGRLSSSTGVDSGWQFYDSTNYDGTATSSTADNGFLRDNTGAISYGLYDIDTTLDENTTKEYVLEVPANAKYLKVCVKLGTYLSTDNFYCYLESGENVVDYVQGEFGKLDIQLYGYDDDTQIGTAIDLSLASSRGFNTNTSYSAYYVGGVIRSINIHPNSFKEIAQSYKKLRVVGNASYTSYYTFYKKYPLPSSSTSFNALVEGGYLCSIHTASQSVVALPIPAGETVDIDIPEDAIGVSFVNRAISDGGSASTTKRKVTSVTPFSQHVRGYLDGIELSQCQFSQLTCGKNKIDPTRCNYDYAVSYVNGTQSAADGLIATNYIEVSKLGLIANHPATSIGSVNAGYAVYNSSKEFVRGVSADNSSYNKYTYQDGDAYVKFTMKADYASTMQVEEGDTVTDYEPYEEYYIVKRDALPETLLSDEDIDEIKGELNADKIFSGKLDVLLPSKYYYVKGDTLQLFYKGMVKAIGLENRYVKPTCSIGKPYHRYLEVASDSSATTGSKSLTVNVYDDNNNILGSASSAIQVVSAPTSPSSEKHILCIGSSTTEGGKWPCECQRRLLASDGTPQGKALSNIEFVGSMSKTLYGQTAHFFAKSGWGWADYATEGRSAKSFRFYLSGTGNDVTIGNVYTNNNYSYTVIEMNTIDDVETILCTTSSSSNTPSPSGSSVNGMLTLSDGAGSATLTYTKTEQGSANPFWDTINNKLSFKPYVDTYCDGTIDLVFIMLGANGLFSYSAAEQKQMASTFVEQLHTEYPDCVVVLVGGAYPSMVNMMPGYGASGNQFSNTYLVVSRLFDVYSAYKEIATEKDYVEFESWSAQFDSDYNFPLTQKNVNTRNSSSTEPYANNTVHPGDAGYMQYADAAYRSVVAHLCQ